MHRDGTHRATRLLLAALAAFAALAALGSFTSSSAAPKRPNIVMLITDDQDFESLSRMPYVSSRGDWVRFDNNVTHHPLCCPSRASMLTGQTDDHTGVVDLFSGHLLNENSTLATWLQADGYRTGLFGKYLNDYPFPDKRVVPPGWDKWFALANPGHQAFYYNYDTIEDGKRTSRGSAPADYSTTLIRNKVRAFITGAGSRPFFAYVAPFAPHAPNIAERKYEAAFTGTPPIRRPNFNEYDVSDKPQYISGQRLLDARAIQHVDEDRRDQYRTLLSVDDMIRNIFETLEATGKLDNTIFLLTSDNGFSFGEHRWINKLCPYEECIHVPLLIRAPSIPGRTVNALTTNIDLAPTLAALAGAEITLTPDGRSLVPLMTGAQTGWDRAVLLHNNTTYPNGSGWGVRTDRYMYFVYDNGDKELYDLQTDPFERFNRFGNPAYRTTELAMAAELARLRGQSASGPGASNPPPGAVAGVDD